LTISPTSHQTKELGADKPGAPVVVYCIILINQTKQTKNQQSYSRSTFLH